MIRTMGLRRAGIADAPVLAAIHAAGFPPGEAWPAAALRELLEQPGVFGLIDPAGGMIMARVAADEAEVLTLAVAPQARRQGRGTALLGDAAAICARHGAARFFLEVSSTNAPAMALYTAAGFGAVGRRPRYYIDGSDAILMRRDLPGPP
jgi:ribosomal-protein-alanine N-acetyltransferase